MSVEATSRHRGPSLSEYCELQVNCGSTPSASQDSEICYLRKFVVVAGTTFGAAAGAIALGSLAMFGSNCCKNTVRAYMQEHMYEDCDYMPLQRRSLEEESSAVGSTCAIKYAGLGASLGAAAGCWLSMRVAEAYF